MNPFFEFIIRLFGKRKIGLDYDLKNNTITSCAVYSFLGNKYVFNVKQERMLK